MGRRGRAGRRGGNDRAWEFERQIEERPPLFDPEPSPPLPPSSLPLSLSLSLSLSRSLPREHARAPFFPPAESSPRSAEVRTREIPKGERRIEKNTLCVSSSSRARARIKTEPWTTRRRAHWRRLRGSKDSSLAFFFLFFSLFCLPLPPRRASLLFSNPNLTQRKSNQC